MLQPYQFQVHHRAGKVNATADALSRAAQTSLLLEKGEGVWWTRSPLQQVLGGQTF